jgi:hypothetical protein
LDTHQRNQLVLILSVRWNLKHTRLCDISPGFHSSDFSAYYLESELSMHFWSHSRPDMHSALCSAPFSQTDLRLRRA